MKRIFKGLFVGFLCMLSLTSIMMFFKQFGSLGRIIIIIIIILLGICGYFIDVKPHYGN